jgi:uncharacterized protein YchJ
LASQNKINHKITSKMSEAPIKLRPQDTAQGGQLVPYNEVTGFKEVVAFPILGKQYAMYEQFCKNRECKCTQSRMDLIEMKDNKLTDNVYDITYDYEKKQILEASPTVSPEFEASLVDNQTFNLRLKYRHYRIKIAYNYWLIKNKNKQILALQSRLLQVNGKIGRNDPCPCGSGKKHKKCCGE